MKQRGGRRGRGVGGWGGREGGGGGLFSRFSALNVAVGMKLTHVCLGLLQVSQEPCQLLLVLPHKLLEELLENLR